jgi:hypothetical protein
MPLNLIGDLDQQRTVGPHLVDVDPEQELEILGRGLERPLVAFEAQPDEVAERRQRLVAISVQQLDHDVGEAVGLGGGPGA